MSDLRNGRDPIPFRLGATAPVGLASDELRLARAAWLCETGRPREAHDEALNLLPYAAADRKRLILAHLILARSASLSGHLREAGEAFAEAHRLADTSKAGELRVPVLCLRAQSTADPRRAVHHARRAVSFARTSTWNFHAHATLAALLVDRAPYEAVEQARLARPDATGDAKSVLDAIEASAFERLLSPVETVRIEEPVPAAVYVTDPPHLMLGDPPVRLNVGPDLALLVAYLTEHPGARLTEVAERLLPEGRGTSGRVRHDDAAHRVARVRQVVQRLRRLVGDREVVVSSNGRLHLGPDYCWTSDLTRVRQDPALLAPTLATDRTWPIDPLD
ncbi:hypothetical protein [Deinococcus sedimenti]|uniref:Uncharacterized protein n=1 Tax=Deinococcus sedimenti TaxID=1867090 RepID=A0ABQ2SBN6_9DEIO|nr:hypothetical protein [Deinococcus sedimenti]GGS10458.1 hypothetical protein GCM10008960_40700 [Deinococcus sedimenti]